MMEMQRRSEMETHDCYLEEVFVLPEAKVPLLLFPGSRLRKDRAG